MKEMYSLDYRQRVLEIKKQENLTNEETSKRFGVNIRSIFRWQKRIKPKTKRNKPATKVNMESLKKDVEKNPDRFQYERAKDYGVTAWTIGVALRRLKISNKKNSKSSEGRRSVSNTISEQNDSLRSD